MERLQESKTPAHEFKSNKIWFHSQNTAKRVCDYRNRTGSGSLRVWFSSRKKMHLVATELEKLNNYQF